MPEARNYPLPGAANDTWRAWLMTGVRRDQGDRRRIRGSHLGLKRMLVEGMKVRVDRPYTWKEFSDALVRQAVGDAVRSLPHRDADLLKLAYFGGMSNRDISRATGMPQATIERRLRHAISTVARFVEHGRGLGQRALGAVVLWLSGNWFHGAVLPAAQATAIAGRAAILAVQPPAVTPPVGSPYPPPSAPATKTTQIASAPASPAATGQQPATQGQTAEPSAPAPVPVPVIQPQVAVTAPQLPVTVPLPLPATQVALEAKTPQL